jgi:8-oxo-dGTP pyrophosphatase MutT (NUDIX family)
LLVRDTGESHYSLPGGGCELGESAVEAFRRELMEEAQCEASNLILLGCTKVDIYDETKKVHLQSISQVRFYCEIKNINNFMPNKDGFEVEERILTPFYDLPGKIDWLNGEVGKLFLDEVSKLD